MTKWPHLILIAGAVLLMQLHSCLWWLAEVGTTGPAWSLLLEAAALWLWWQGGRPALAVLASALLIAGPLLHLSEPVIADHRASVALAEQIAIDREEVAQLQASLARYESNSAERLGWAQRIDDTRADLDAARARVRAGVSASAAQPPEWEAYLIPALQGAALLLVMVTQILAVRTLRPRPSSSEPASPAEPKPRKAKPAAAAPKTTRPAPSKAVDCPLHTTGAGPCYCPGSIYDADATDRLAERVAAEIESDMQARGETQAALAKRLGCRAADVSMIRKHTERRKAGKETASKAVIQRLATHYEINKENR